VETAIIFGGTKGIGKIISDHFINKKICITVCARNIIKGDEKENVNILQCNVTEFEEVKNAFENHKNKFGTTPDFIINAAGVQGELGYSWTVSQEDFENTIKINLIGSFNVTKAAIENLIEQKKNGSIILFSGGGSCYARPNFCAYGVSKTGVLRFVETVSEELKISGNEKIMINALAPGAVNTQMTQEVLNAKERAGIKAYKEAEDTYKKGGTNPEEITNLVDFLCDFKTNRFISGRLIHVREKYLDFVNSELLNKEENGKLRRVNLI
jgi:3-oxoacyl-[acyl-carrier protein] reductase